MWRNGANGASLSPNALTGRKRDFLLKSLDINEKRICHITGMYHEPMQKRCTAQVSSFDTHEHVIGLLIQSSVSYTDFSPEDGGSLFFLYVGTTNKSHSIPIQNITINIVTAVRISNLSACTSTPGTPKWSPLMWFSDKDFLFSRFLLHVLPTSTYFW